ncbi:glycosyltransferase family 4 protein [Bacillus sp. 2205SS5-2]|uniref:glycosyltransferase family 4 protein n=1 Tax=Bacillus sp. 2205SS5-2 TaxID=3109031 RepID=UPI0030060F15
MKDTPKKIILVAPFTILRGEKGFNRFEYIARKLSEQGHKVTLVTSNFRHQTKKFRNEDVVKDMSEKVNYNVELMGERGYKKNIGIGRVLSHRHFARNLKAYLKTLKQKPDLLYCAYPMMESALEVGRYAKREKIPFVLDIQDVWPEAIKTAVPLPEKITNVMLLPLTLYANKIYKLADYVVGVSQSYVDRVEMVNKYAKMYLPVYIGTDLGYFDDTKRKNVVEKNTFWITYIGTLSYSYDIETVIKAVAHLKNKGIKDIRFKIMGSGPHKSKFELLAQTLEAPVDFLGHLSYQDMVPLLSQSDIAANAISRGAQQSITNKIGDYLSAGLPILNSSQNEEFKKMISQYQLGESYLPGDYIKLATLIEELYHNEISRKLYGNNSRKVAEGYFDRRYTYQSIYQLVRDVSG